MSVGKFDAGNDSGRISDRGSSNKGTVDIVDPQKSTGVEVDDLITDLLNHVSKISIQIILLFTFYILGRIGFFWTTLALVGGGYVCLKYVDPVREKCHAVLRHVNPKDTEKVKDQDVCRRPRDLPRWVRFPDEESVHWINNIIAALWPSICTYAESMIREKVDPILVSKVPPVLSPVELSKLDFGSISPLVGSLNVYNDDFTKRDELIMDLELYYAGNCDFRVSVRNHVAAKLCDAQFFGHCRLILSPLTKQIPLVDAFKFYFTRTPQMFWRGKKLLYLLEYPKFSDMIVEQVIDQLAKIVIFPNSFSMVLRNQSDSKVALQSPIAEGVLRIALKGARNLMNRDTIGKSDPYCVTVVGSNTFRSRVVDDNLNPVWNEYYELPVYNPVGLSADFYLYDEDLKNDEPLGSTTVALSQLSSEGFLDIWTPLADAKKGEMHVQIQYCCLYPKVKIKDKFNAPKFDIEALSDVAQNEIQQHFGSQLNSSSDAFSRCYLNVFVDSASNLPRNHPSDVRAYPSPYVKVTIAGHKTEGATKIEKDLCNPVWEQAFDFLVNNTAEKTVNFEILDSEKVYAGHVQAVMGHAQSMLGQIGIGGSQHRLIGTVKVPIVDVLNSSDLTLEMPFAIQGTAESQLLVRITARFILKSPVSGAGEERQNQKVAGRESGMGSGSDWPDGQGSVSPTVLSRSQSMHSMLRTGRISRKGSMSSIREALPTARLFLKLSYVRERNKLIVEVEKAEGLSAPKLHPYVVVKLKPDGVKKKTDAVRTQNGSVSSLAALDLVVWHKAFEFAVPLHELTNKTVVAKVKNSAVFPRSDTKFGYVCVPLVTVSLDQPFLSWFVITPEATPQPLAH